MDSQRNNLVKYIRELADSIESRNTANFNYEIEREVFESLDPVTMVITHSYGPRVKIKLSYDDYGERDD